MKSASKKQLLKSPNLYQHVTRNVIWAFFLTSMALFCGMLGYHHIEKMNWIDAFMNASMILSGMGPATALTTNSGKLFAGFYALFSGLAFIAIMVIILSPLIHQFFRKIHLENNSDTIDDN